MKAWFMKTIPYHVVLFPDGNRRWAKEKGLPALKGHWEGYKNLLKFCRWCQKRGVKVITAFGFSTENWDRSKREVSYLMKLLERGISDKSHIKDLQKYKVKVKIIGQKKRLPESLQKAITRIEALTKNNNELQLNLAISYGGRWDIVQAVQQIVRKKIPSPKITEELITNHLSTAGLPDPDLIIRPGGERRLSNFVLWQGTYSELYFCEKYWPAFTEKDLDEAIREYAQRNRRFGQ